MGFTDDLGVGGYLPEIDLTGFLSSSWIYVFIICALGFILILGIVVFLFFITYNKKLELYENISGAGYQRVSRVRARTVKLGVGGGELLKTIKGTFLTAYGKKIGRNLFAFAKGPDGYYYNILFGDLDTKFGVLDVEPTDRDLRMFHVALDRLSQQTYGKQDKWEKFVFYGLMFAFLITLVLGMWFIVGKIGDAVEPLSQASDNALEIQKVNAEITGRLESIARALGHRVDEQTADVSSGIVSAGGG